VQDSWGIKQAQT